MKESADQPVTTADRLRADIDAGRTGDKVPVSDPAAAPLGTDEEAAGVSPSAADVALAHRYETARPHHPPPRRGLGHAWILVAIILVFAGGILAWGFSQP